MERFQQECAFLENIRHPNIVQYLGMTRDPESRLPVLLIELLDESLTKMLEHSQWPLAYYVQVDICHDIALAVAYLHSNDIVHRDLSSNNVLIMAKSRAKVTDFGMSKLASAAPSMTPLTMCPGTLAYMPPEALNEPPVYTKKLDCFSEGVIMIQVCTRLWPEPGPRNKTVQDSRSPTGRMQMPVLESERRKNHIDMIDRGHGLLSIAMDCLHYQENERPSSEELCQWLAGLKEMREYRESIEQVERVPIDIAELERQIGEMQVREAATVQQLHELHDESQQQHQRYQGEIQHLESEIQSKDVQLKQQDEQHRFQVHNLKQMLEEQEQVTTEIQQACNSLQRQVEHLQQLSQQTQQNTNPSQPPPPIPPRARRQLRQDHSMKDKQSTPSPQQIHRQESHLPMKQIKLRKCRDGGWAPYKMSRGAAIVDGNVAYFMNWNGQTCSFDKSMQEWSKLPWCPYKDCTSVLTEGILTAIAGNKGGVIDNKLLSIINKEDQKWVEHFPPMLTRRSHAAAVTTKQHLIVAGGENGSNRLDKVEVMDVQTLVWSTAASLPHPYSNASATICGNQLPYSRKIWRGIKFGGLAV